MQNLKVSYINSLNELIKSSKCRHIIDKATEEATYGMSAEEFLSHFKPTIRFGASIGKAIGDKIGLKSKTGKILTISTYYLYVLLAVLCALAKQGFQIIEANETEHPKTCFLIAQIPSSPLTWEGQIYISILQQEKQHTITASVTFPGQLFAWGRGSRIIKRLFEDTDKHVKDFEAEAL